MARSAVTIANTDDCREDVKKDDPLFLDSESSVMPRSELNPTQIQESTNAFNNDMFYVTLVKQICTQF
jgi:hypothetical protein